MCGGAAASTVTPEIIADAVGLPVECALQTETSCLGAAVLARRMVDRRKGLAELATRMKPATRSVAPGSGRDEAAARLQEYLSWARSLSHKPSEGESKNRVAPPV
jgi:sugar (pentulose or hexulose) kinase